MGLFGTPSESERVEGAKIVIASQRMAIRLAGQALERAAYALRDAGKPHEASLAMTAAQAALEAADD
jgi:hypothetical protein